MAYRYGNRAQQELFPASAEQLVSADDPVRAYDAFVEALDLAALGLKIDPRRVGNSAYDPKAMAKLLVYGYSYGIRSSRKLERALYHNVSFMWLMGDLKPDHKTIAEFRRRHAPALSRVLKQCARLCLRLGLIEGNTLFVDGSKMRANAGIKRTWTRQRCREMLAKLDERVAQILSECETADEAESSSSSLVHLKTELSDRETLRAKVAELLETMQAEDKTSINTTDPECAMIHGRQGTHAGYNVQSVVDDRHGLIVSSDVTDENNDLNQFARQIDQAQETLGQPCETACADAGYADVEELEKIDRQGVEVIVPSSRQASEKTPGPFDASAFTYDREQDTYTCPQGHVLRYSQTNWIKQHRVYRIGGSTCRQCPHQAACSKNRRGRTLTRSLRVDVAEKLAAQYEREDAQTVYRRRKHKVEPPFGHIKHNLGVTGFLLRGLAAVKAEVSILATCFNMARMITLLGVPGLVATLGK
jgi:transposase